MTDTTGRRPGPLSGLLVADFSRILAGPYASMLLADLGADVVKVEPPRGDEARGWGPPWLGGEGMNYMAMNRNKRSIALDLKDPDGRALAQRLCADADVVVENFRPGVAERLGIDFETLRADNPGLVYVSISGFGRTGPDRDRPALDLVLQGAAGVMDRQGGDGPPRPIVITVADCYAASLAIQGVLAALLARARDGEGQRVDVTLFEAVLAIQTYRVVTGAGEQPQLPAASDAVPYQAFETADGWVTIAAVTERSWGALCDALGLERIRDDPRFATNGARVTHQRELLGLLAAELARHATDALLELLDAAGVPCGRVRRVEDLFFDAGVVENELIVEIDHPTAGPVWTLGVPFRLAGTPLTVRRPAPLLGQHTDELLAEAGVAPAEIERLRSRGALGASPAMTA